jgi:phosphonate transport system substrate-binding protein
MVRNDVPDQLRDRIRDLLVGLQYTEEGRMLLSGMETARFHLATDADYAPVRKFIQRFERDIRHVELKE